MSKILNVKKTLSKGISICKAFIVKKADLSPEEYLSSDINQEIEKFNIALEKARLEIEKLAQENEFFNGHKMLIEDPVLIDSILNKISNDNKNAQVALKNGIEEISALFSMMEDEYMRERADDIKDIGNRIMSKLKNIAINPFESINEECILIAEDLSPSDTALINLEYVKGFITELGGVTGHVSIIARNLGLPALVGVNGILDSVNENDLIIMDAGKGNIIINPSEEDLSKYKKLLDEFNKEQEIIKKLDTLKAKTKDGKEVTLCANVGSLVDIEMATKFNIEGVGLFRSECVYMNNKHFPTEEEQFNIYKEAAILLKGKELTIRTLDIGGDKSLPYYDFEFEENPFLGWRAIRISLELKDIFKAQLKAILRASAFGYVRIMYPMIISIEELLLANQILEECKKELTENKIDFNKNIEVGMMIETPASVIMAEEFAKYVDFFSIGTNDLTQYMLVVDRGNKKISNLYNSFNPAVLKSIKSVIDAGHKHNIKVGMCGEFASDTKATKMLLGFGLDEFSMSASEINNVKKYILDFSFEEAEQYANNILKQTTIEDVMKVISN